MCSLVYMASGTAAEGWASNGDGDEMDSYLIVILLGHQSALSQYKIEGGAGHECPVAHVTKHDRKQKGEGDDGVWSWRQGGEALREGGRRHMRGGLCRNAQHIANKKVMVDEEAASLTLTVSSATETQSSAIKRFLPILLRACKISELWHVLTWVHLTVGADSVGINNVLKARGELVGLVIGGRGLLGLHPIEDGRHSGAAPLLITDHNTKTWFSRTQ